MRTCGAWAPVRAVTRRAASGHPGHESGSRRSSCCPVGERRSSHRRRRGPWPSHQRAPSVVPSVVLALETGQPGLDLTDSEAQLAADTEASRTAPLAAQVVDRLGAHLQLGAELGEGQDPSTSDRLGASAELSRIFSVFMTVGVRGLPRTHESAPRWAEGCCRLRSNVRSKRGVAMLSPVSG